MPPGPAPKPTEDRRRTNEPTFGWTDLPAAGREGPPPAMSDDHDYSEFAEWWADLWSSPQAEAWDQSGRTMFGYLECKRLLNTIEIVQRADGRELAVPAAPRTAILAEMRQIEDRHGLNPKAMMQLRWRIVDGVAPAVKPKKPPARRRDPRLRAINGGKGS